MTEEELKIIVCTHKLDYAKSDSFFLPIHVGKASSHVQLNFQGDDTGENISIKNSSFCELTGMYWAWKNLEKVDYIGLNHYRRYFAFGKKTLKEYIPVSIEEYQRFETSKFEILKNLKDTDIILPKKKILVKSLWRHYSDLQFERDLEILVSVISKLYPDYTETVHKYLKENNKFPAYNMFIMKFSEFDRYCSWLFPILFECEKRIDISNYSVSQRRVFGYLGELIMGMYVIHNKLKVKELPIYWLNNNQYGKSSLNFYISSIKSNIRFFINRYK